MSKIVLVLRPHLSWKPLFSDGRQPDEWFAYDMRVKINLLFFPFFGGLCDKFLSLLGNT